MREFSAQSLLTLCAIGGRVFSAQSLVILCTRGSPVHSLCLLSVPEKGGSSVHSLWLLSIRISVDVLKPFHFQTQSLLVLRLHRWFESLHRPQLGAFNQNGARMKFPVH